MPLLSFKQPYNFVILLLLLVFICSYNSENNDSKGNANKKDSSFNVKSKSGKGQDPPTENFDDFFRKFEADSVFQLARVSFPLKVIYKSDDGDSIRILKKNNWKYISFRGEKHIVISKKLIRNKQVNVNLSVEDTGISVNHFFTNNNGKWQLISVEDESD